MTEKQEGANELLLHDEQGGGRKQKWHVLHHLFTQRLYSMIHPCLASLANYNLEAPSENTADAFTCGYS